VRGHAAGPKWVSQLPQGKLPANVRLERNALVGLLTALSHSGSTLVSRISISNREAWF
jgi:hypothetical protein